MIMSSELKPLHFIGSAHDDLLEMPAEVRREFGYALYLIQRGETPENASPFEGTKASEVMKLVELHDGDTYRCVYAAKLEKAIFVLHVFKKKSTSGIRTPQKEIDTVYSRLETAKAAHAAMMVNKSADAERARRRKK